MIQQSDLLDKLKKLSEQHEKNVPFAFQMIVQALDLKEPDYKLLEHTLWQLVQKGIIKKIGMDDNYRKCLFIQIQDQETKGRTVLDKLKNLTKKKGKKKT